MIKYVAIDIETTGLEPTRDRILEFAAVFLDEDFVEVEHFETPVQYIGWRDIAPPVVQEMHDASGLAAQLAEFDWMPPIERAVERVLSGSTLPVLVGSSVHFDRAFLRHWYPRLDALFSHRHVDASTVKILAPHHAWPVHPGPVHRALPDARHSVEIIREARRLLNLGERELQSEEAKIPVPLELFDPVAWLQSEDGVDCAWSVEHTSDLTPLVGNIARALALGLAEAREAFYAARVALGCKDER